jgi:HD-like signal output (HDOD) protein
MSPQQLELALPAAIALLLLLMLAAALLWWRRRRRKHAVQHPTATMPSVAAAPPAAPVVATPSAPAPLNPAAAAAPVPRPVLPEAGPVIARLYAMAFDDAPLDDPAVRKAHAEVVRGTVQSLLHIEDRPEYSPRRPQLLPRLMRELDEDENSLRGLAQLVGRDPTLAGNVLRTVNTPLYRSSSAPIESIERAVAIVGTTGLRSMVAAALLQPELSGGKGAFGRFPDIIWDHSLHSAMAAASYAVLVADTDPFAAELLGMLMGLGSIIIVRVVRDEYALRPHLLPSASIATAVLDSWTSPTARHIAKSWELSNRMSLAVHEQLLDKSARHLSPLGRSLRFGRIAGAAALLVRANRMDPDEGRALLGDPADEQLDSIWRKLVRDRR